VPDFYSIEWERVKQRMATGVADKFANLFKSERVVETFDEEKCFVSSYDERTALGLAAFAPVQYTMFCPGCVTTKNISNFRALVTHGLVVPILRANYSAYPEYW
jgi:hypothetical protein